MTLALALRADGWNVALVEARNPPEAPGRNAEYDLRVSAVSPASRGWLERVGVWPLLDANRVCAYRAMQVWTGGPVGKLRFESTRIHVPELGHIVENRAMLAAAWSLAKPLDIYCPARVAGLVVAGDSARVSLEDGRELTSSLVVGADGPHSRTRRLTGLGGGGKSYGQRGLVGVVSTSGGHDNTAWQRFLPGGPLALLPLANGQVSIVWSAPEPRVRELEAMPDKLFRAHLRQASGAMLGDVTDNGPRASFPLQMCTASDYVAPRVVLAGDAAHVIHPLAGQGVNLGFMDAQALAQALKPVDGETRDPGTRRRLRRYVRTRKGDNLAMLAVTDGLHRLFTARHPLARAVRGPGLSMVNAVGPARNILTKQATGERYIHGNE